MTERNTTRRGARWLRIGLAAVALAIPAGTQPFLGTTTASAAGAPHVMVVVMEDQAYSSIIGNTAQAPFLNQMASTFRYATNWYGLQHSSLADYVALISGTTGTYTAPTIAGSLGTGGWKAYMENAPSVCYTGTGAANYSKVHNPFVHFKSITGTPAQCNNVVPFAGTGGFASDLANNTAPPFMFVVPNSCDDMHSGCGSIAKGDSWLSSNLSAVWNSAWYHNGGHVIITWDAGAKNDTTFFNTGSGGHVPTIVISETARGKGAYAPGGNQYGILRGIEEAYGIGLLGASATAANGDLLPAF